MLDLDYVITIHDEILIDLGGLPGFAAGGRGGVEAALVRIENHAHYNGVTDVFGIAAMYTVAIAREHVFNDANKRTGLACALTYLERENITIRRTPELEEVVVDVAKGDIDHEMFASFLYGIWLM